MRGGYREGAGRKKGFAAKNAEQARSVLSEMVIRDIIPIGEALISKAKQGDISAVKELFDRSWGKSYQSMQIVSAGLVLPSAANPSELAVIAAAYEEELRKYYQISGSK